MMPGRAAARRRRMREAARTTSGWEGSWRGQTQWSQGFVHVDELAPMCHKRPLLGEFIPEIAIGRWPPGTVAAAVREDWEFYTNAHTLSKLVSIDEEAQRELRARLPPPVLLEVAPGDLVMLSVQQPPR